MDSDTSVLQDRTPQASKGIQIENSGMSTREKLLLLSIAFAEMCAFASNTVLVPLYPESVSTKDDYFWWFQPIHLLPFR
jgi:hypothetical protein